MLTVDFERLGLRPGDRVLDLGCGAGRHAFEMYRRGADVIAFDQDADELSRCATCSSAMADAGEVPAGAEADVKEGDALSLPFADGEFDRVVAAEILEHVPADIQALGRARPVLRPGGTIALTVPRWLPEVICWKPPSYHNTPGGHIRIYSDAELVTKAVERPGLCTTAATTPTRFTRRTGGSSAWSASTNDDHPLAKAYHRLLVWDIMKAPRTTRWAEKALNPLIGKSLVVYLAQARGAPMGPELLTRAAGRAVRGGDRGRPGARRGHPVDRRRPYRRLEPRRGGHGTARRRPGTTPPTARGTGSAGPSAATAPGR